MTEFTDTNQFIAAFDEKNKSGEQFIVYLTGGVNAEGVSWCPDCDKARPAIKEHVLDKTKLTVLKGVVDDRNTWVGVADHPYKKHALIKAGGVPCLLLVQSSNVLVRVEDEKDFGNVEMLTMIAEGDE